MMMMNTDNYAKSDSDADEIPIYTIYDDDSDTCDTIIVQLKECKVEQDTKGQIEPSVIEQNTKTLFQLAPAKFNFKKQIAEQCNLVTHAVAEVQTEDCVNDKDYSGIVINSKNDKCTNTSTISSKENTKTQDRATNTSPIRNKYKNRTYYHRNSYGNYRTHPNYSFRFNPSHRQNGSNNYFHQNYNNNNNYSRPVPCWVQNPWQQNTFWQEQYFKDLLLQQFYHFCRGFLLNILSNGRF